MCRLIETIRIENGVPSLLPLHQERVDWTRKELFGLKDDCNLEDHLSDFSLPQLGIWKCRMTYGVKIEKTEFEPYQKKSIQSLQIIVADDFIYEHKFANREGIQHLFNLRKQADDILIIKNQLLTDTSYCNVALWNGKNWITPLYPLLKGVRRESLISSGIVQTGDISIIDLKNFYFIKLFNSMISFEEAEEISISSIFI
jgi:4-amino-4-deoxychorismate lyase